jgi:hypothetical protein
VPTFQKKTATLSLSRAPDDDVPVGIELADAVIVVLVFQAGAIRRLAGKLQGGDRRRPARGGGPQLDADGEERQERGGEGARLMLNIAAEEARLLVSRGSALMENTRRP